MYIRFLLNLLLIIGLVVLQVSFINGLPFYSYSLNLPLVILIFILALSGLRKAFWWSFGIGFFLDIFSFLPFGTYTIIFFLTIVISHFLLSNFFTSHSLYSFLVLTIITTACYEIFSFLLRGLSIIFGDPGVNMIVNVEFLQLKFIQLCCNLFAVIIIFYAINFVSYKSKPIFIIKNK